MIEKCDCHPVNDPFMGSDHRLDCPIFKAYAAFEAEYLREEALDKILRDIYRM